MKHFNLKILGFNSEIFNGKVLSLSLVAIDGNLQILANHIPYINVIKPKSKITFVGEDGTSKQLELNSGFVKVCKDNLVYIFAQV